MRDILANKDYPDLAITILSGANDFQCNYKGVALWTEEVAPAFKVIRPYTLMRNGELIGRGRTWGRMAHLVLNGFGHHIDTQGNSSPASPSIVVGVFSIAFLFTFGPIGGENMMLTPIQTRD